MKLIENAREWHRLWSMRWIIASAFFSSVIVAYATLPVDWLPALGDDVKRWLAIGALASAAGAGVSRVVKQKNLPEPCPPDPVEPPRTASTP